jgi:hypothetical protein
VRFITAPRYALKLKKLLQSVNAQSISATGLEGVADYFS